MASISISSPLGTLTAISHQGAITRLKWGQSDEADEADEAEPELIEAKRQLKAYFDGTLQTFDLPLAVAGSDLQKAVCDAMSAIPFGETLTYGEIAQKVGAPAQAIGSACGANPIPVIIPCHRVLAATSLGGFSGWGGVETKVWLLRHEGAAGLLI